LYLQTMLVALFPDLPVNAGLEKLLGVVAEGISKAAQSLMSLSFLILPVVLAVGIKMFQWLGPFPAAAAVLIPLSALFAAESILAERTILPLSGENLAPYATGKPVRSLPCAPACFIVSCYGSGCLAAGSILSRGPFL
jgi:hypothetical protein